MSRFLQLATRYKITYMLTSSNIALLELKLWVPIDGTMSNTDEIHSYNLLTSYSLHTSKATNLMSIIYWVLVIPNSWVLVIPKLQVQRFPVTFYLQWFTSTLPKPVLRDPTWFPEIIFHCTPIQILYPDRLLQSLLQTLIIASTLLSIPPSH